MKPELQVEKALAKTWAEIPASGRILLAVSGGVDSMVLLEAASRLAAKNFQSRHLLVVHVNHSLREGESDGDEALVLKRASELGLESRSKRLTWNRETASQDACRKKREAFFASLLSGPEDRILLAHHLNDQAETVLFRLIRGTGARGLKGMLPASGAKLRPFLGIPKSALLECAEAWGIAWREDRSNLSLDYDRNWVRSLFPQIEARRPGFQEKLAALAEEAAGWKFQGEQALRSFSVSDSVSFSRPETSTSTAILQEEFRLGRMHAKALRELLGKSSGKWEAEGVRFTWSAGMLLAERDGGRFSAALSGRQKKWRSGLGIWTLPEAMSPYPKGDSAKKEFQSLRVPIFFREAIPMLTDPRGRPVALLPERFPRLGDVRFTPSPLAKWWLGGR